MLNILTVEVANDVVSVADLIIWFQVIVIPLIILILGAILYFKTPKMNPHFGFRFRSAYQSSESWHYANKLTGKLFFYTGLVATIIYLPFIIILFPRKLGNAFPLALIPTFITVITLIVEISIILVKIKKFNQNHPVESVK
ncbi:MAG: SdpI family protein [Acholeplasmatales bacterium]|jgi:uncharacterized membrane protein|nr:SdpI family protein [Acholeplasmatales bacterium]